MCPRRKAFALAAVLMATAVGCTAADDPRVPNPLESPPVDTARIKSVEEAAAWPHREVTDADLDGDGAAERVILAADVTVRPDGRPIWEDGHRWAVIVEDAGERTLLYAAFVPNGDADAAVLTAADDDRRHVLIRERTPQQSRTLVVAYDRPGAARTVSAADDQIEQWLPSLTAP